MALQSQAPRSGSNRRYAASTRRKKSLAPWLVLLGLVVIVAGLIVIFSDSADPTADTIDTTGPAANTEGTPADPNPRPDPTQPDTSLTAGTPSGEVSPPASSDEAAAPIDTTASTAEEISEPAGHTPAYPGQPNPGDFNIGAFDTQALDGQAKDTYELGMQRLEAGDYVTGRALLSELLFRDGALPRHEAQAVRERLTHLNEQSVFGLSKKYWPVIDGVQQDPIRTLHKVQSGEYLSTIGNTYRLPYQLIERINKVEARRLQAGQTLQILRGPVHARIDKSDYRMDLFVEDPDGLRIYLKSYTVGLGEFDSTPIGKWIVKPGSKVGPANGGPSWVNPRTGERFDRNDPNIPIGEYWMALQGIDDNTRDQKGYGIHATNDPDSIGQQASMGCVRMSDQDVDEVFYTLFEGASVVEIVP